MEKRNIILFSLITIFMSLVYMYLDYYGYVRYHTLRQSSDIDSYVKAYKTIDREQGKRVVVSLTTKTPERALPTLLSILDQTVSVSEISLTVSNDVTVPKDFERFLNVYRVSIDYDGTNAILPVVIREREADTIIIVIRDDIIYAKDFVEDVLVLMSKCKECTYLMDSKKTFMAVVPDIFDVKVCDKDTSLTNCFDWVLVHNQRGRIERREFDENYSY